MVLVGVAAVVGVRLLGADKNQPDSGAPSPSAAPPTSSAAPEPASPSIKLSSQVTDASGVLGPLEYAAVDRAVTKLYNERGTKLWVVYVNDFGGLLPLRWAEDTMRANSFTDTDAMLAIATDQPSFSFRVPGALLNGTAIDVEMIRRDRIGPAVYQREWARAAIAAANGLDVANG